MKAMYFYFKTVLMIVMCVIVLPGLSTTAEAQILKKIGNKIEKSIDRRVDRKIDKGVEKSLDKVEDGIDHTAKEATSEKPKKESSAGQKDEDVSTKTLLVADNNPYSDADAEKAKANNGMILVSGNCNDFAWFKKGAEMEYEINTRSEKKPYTSKIKIVNVRSEGVKTIADVLGSDGEGNEINMNYICSGNKLYFDLTDMLKSAMEKQGQSSANMEISFDGGLMAIPKNIYPGQELEDAVFTMNMGTQGMTISMTSFLKERKVVGKEKVTTPAGTFNCIKITGVRTMKMKMMGKDRNVGDEVIEEMYFAPSIGVIKSVSKTTKGKIESEQQLTKLSI